MPSYEKIHGSPADWMARARSDLSLARIPLPDNVYWEDLCFHAQQAAEKAIKAVYRHRGLGFSYTHDLEMLLSGLAAHGEAIPQEVVDSDLLTPYAWAARYPESVEPATEQEYREAVRMAAGVVAWAEGVLGS